MALVLPVRSSRGVVFTLMAIVIASVIVVSASVLMDTGKQTDITPDHVRVRVVDSAVDSFKSYSQIALRVSVFSGLNNLTNILANQSDDEMSLYFASLEALEGNLSNCILHPEGAGKPIGPPGAEWDSSCHTNKTFPALIEEFASRVGEQLSIDISFVIDNSSFNIWEEFPFEAVANISMNVTITDANSLVSWNISPYEFEVIVPLEGLQDPVTTKFEHSNYSTDFEAFYFVQGESPGGKDVLATNIGGALFSRSLYAPSILQRFIGDFSNSTCGPPDSLVTRSCGVEAFIDGNDVKWGEFPEGQENYSHLDYELLVPYPPRAVPCENTMYYVNFSDTTDAQDEDIFWANASTLARLAVNATQWMSCS